VLLFSDAPCADLGFIKRILMRNKNIETVVRTLKNETDFFEGAFPSEIRLRETDVFMLLAYSGRAFPASVWGTISSLIMQDGKPFLLIAGGALDAILLRSIDARFPASVSAGTEGKLITPNLTADGARHPLLRIRENGDENRILWERLPPVYSVWNRIVPKSGSKMLAEGVPESGGGSKDQANIPLIVSGQEGNKKSAVVFASGLFRWDLVSWGVGETNEVLAKFLDNAVRWLSLRDEGKRIRFASEQRILQAGEETEIAVQVLDELYRPLPGAEVKVSFVSPNPQSDLLLQETDPGLYQSPYRPADEGKIKAVAEARMQGRLMGRDTVEFTVQPYMPELSDTGANPDLMRALAKVSSGRMIDPDSLQTLPYLLNAQPESVKIHKDIELLNRPFLLAMAVLCLAVEWIMRKRLGMV
jgi:hypothetical protein